MGAYLSKYTIWALLNVGLPGGAAALTYWLAYVGSLDSSPDDLLVISYASGDLLIVAVVMVVVIVYEVLDYQTRSSNVLCTMTVAGCFLLTLLLSAVFGAVKVLSFAEIRPNLEMLHYFAWISIVALGFVGFLALTIKFLLLLRQWWKEYP